MTTIKERKENIEEFVQASRARENFTPEYLPPVRDELWEKHNKLVRDSWWFKKAD